MHKWRHNFTLWRELWSDLIVFHYLSAINYLSNNVFLLPLDNPQTFQLFALLKLKCSMDDFVWTGESAIFVWHLHSYLNFHKHILFQNIRILTKACSDSSLTKSSIACLAQFAKTLFSLDLTACVDCMWWQMKNKLHKTQRWSERERDRQIEREAHQMIAAYVVCFDANVMHSIHY